MVCELTFVRDDVGPIKKIIVMAQLLQIFIYTKLGCITKKKGFQEIIFYTYIFSDYPL